MRFDGDRLVSFTRTIQGNDAADIMMVNPTTLF